LYLAISPARAADACNQRFPVTIDNQTLYNRFCANVDLETRNESITRIVVVIQSLPRTASAFSRDLISEAEAVGAHNVAIIAPWFPRSTDFDTVIVDENDQPVDVDNDGNVAEAEDDGAWIVTDPDDTWEACTGEYKDDLYYGSNWNAGDESFTGSGESCSRRPFTISSFRVLDLILERAVELYPNARKSVFITGHSAGGQMVIRYAGFATIPDDVLEQNVQFAPANPSSFPYLTAERPRPPYGQFPITFGVPVASDCDGSETGQTGFDDYNAWKYGFDGGFNSFRYLSTFPFSTVDNNYRRRRLLLMNELSDNDDNGSLAKDCEAYLQGGLSRLARAESYYQHLIDHFGWQKVVEGSLDWLYTNHGGKHGGTELWSTDCGRYALWGANASQCADRSLFQDNFDIDLLRWTQSGAGKVKLSGAHRAEGHFSAEFAGPATNLTLTSPDILTKGVLTVSWAWWIDSRLDAGESLIAEASIDGGPWSKLEQLDGQVDQENQWIYSGTTVDVTKSLRLRFIANIGSGDEAARLDAVRVFQRRGL
jgi:hypothetical protein